MIKLYIKQAWTLMKQNKLFSALYIAGTGLAIAMTVVIAVVYYVKIAPIYPEVNRMNTYYLDRMMVTAGTEGEQNQYQWSVSHKALQEWFYPTKNAVCVSGSLDDSSFTDCYVQPADMSGDFSVKVKLTDPNFFRIYPFRFLEGNPFTESDLESGIRTAVITDDLSRRLFGTTEGVVGQTFTMDYAPYRVCGVVEGASYLMDKAYAQIYLPYSIAPGYREGKYGLEYLGSFHVTFLMKDGEQTKALRAEIAEIERKQNLMHEADNINMKLFDQPLWHVRWVFDEWADEEFDVWATVRYFLLLLLVLLLVPALNLSGMISSRMESRIAEMGVRKCFGASRRTLLSQVMWENLLPTLFGGLLGLVVAWLLLYVTRDWVFTMFDQWAEVIGEGTTVKVTGEMLFAPLVFLAALLFCVLLNLLSALIPAWMSLRKPIVQSLFEKR